MTISTNWGGGDDLGGEKKFTFLPSLPLRYRTRRPPLGTLETNYKMATSDGERLISTISRKNCGL